ncbi:MAG: delta-60 repeat domain-containing protein [Armatimonadota bacterium]
MKKITFKFLLLALIMTFSVFIISGCAVVETSTGTTSAVTSAIKIIAAGQFSSFNGSSYNNLVQLDDTGTIDGNFNAGTGPAGPVYTTALQDDKKVVIGGFFTSFNGDTHNYIARILANGTIDEDFSSGTGANSFITTMALQNDGKILICGMFTTYNGTARVRIARLNADGTLDTNFDPGDGANQRINSIALQTNGSILIGGIFTAYNGTARAMLARVNPDGTLDAAFDPGTGANNNVSSINVLSDGKILITGAFTTYNGTTVNRIARLNVDGTIDNTFNNGGAGANDSIRSAAVLSDGSIIICGIFTTYNGTARSRVAKLSSDGTLNEDFDPGTGADAEVNTLKVQSTGKILIGGDFTNYNRTDINRIARLNADGTLDTSFNPGTGASTDSDWIYTIQTTTST